MTFTIQDVQKTQTQAVSIIDNVNLQQVSATMQKIAQFQAVVQKTLKKDHDYGVIPGTGNKPTLLKPGAEKILMLMGLTSGYEITERIQDYENGFFAFTVKCQLSRNGMVVTEGLGHANTKEARYARRWVTERKLPEGVDKSTLPKREREGRYGKYVEYQVGNDDSYTLANTVLKMAKKRAQIDAVLTVASLSEIFTQDLEDYEDVVTDLVKSQPQMPPQYVQADQNSDDLPATETQLKNIYFQTQQLGLGKETMIAILRNMYDKNSSRELTRQEADSLIDFLSDSTKVSEYLLINQKVTGGDDPLGKFVGSDQ